MIEMTRPNWDETFMDILPILEKRVTCKYYKVAAVLAYKGRIISFGYNGPGRGDVHCTVVGCAKEDNEGNKLPPGSGKCRGCHCEMNVFLNIVFLGISLKEKEAGESTLYVSIRPCFDCAKHIGNSGIKRIIYRDDYDGDQVVFDYCKEREIELIKFKDIKKKEVV
ncbi:MAG: cytidine deaminase [Candidatus Portnoybacteria bacterium]|nr:cytidine deaminase [Candidatus Portnoybacteria bacterium]